jgi:hypothetical protein
MFAEQDAERGRRGDCPKGTACTVHGGKHWHNYGLRLRPDQRRPLYGNDIRRWVFSQVVKRAKVLASDCGALTKLAQRGPLADTFIGGPRAWQPWSSSPSLRRVFGG